MRKRFRVLILAAIAVAVVVPFGLALSVDRLPVIPARGSTLGGEPVQSTLVAMTTGAPALARRVSTPFFNGLPDGAKLLLMGASLLGIAAVVRRAVDNHSRSSISASRAYNRDISAR